MTIATEKRTWLGLYPGEADTIYAHNPLSKKINTSDTLVVGPSRNPVVGFLSNVQTW